MEKLQAWGNSYTRRGRFSPVGIAFHWIMAALILFQIGWGFWTDWMMPGGDKVRAFEIHSAAGLPVLLLAFGRMLWRLLITDPYNDADGQGLQTTIAHGTAMLFYATFLTLPLSGWVMWSSVAAPGPLYLGGVVPWPQIPLSNLEPLTRYAILDIAEDVHVASVILLLLLIHVCAALNHHFWDRHDVLKGMLPEIPEWKGRPEAATNNRPAIAVQEGSDVG
jgi:cytochrome b561